MTTYPAALQADAFADANRYRPSEVVAIPCHEKSFTGALLLGAHLMWIEDAGILRCWANTAALVGCGNLIEMVRKYLPEGKP